MIIISKLLPEDPRSPPSDQVHESHCPREARHGPEEGTGGRADPQLGALLQPQPRPDGLQAPPGGLVQRLLLQGERRQEQLLQQGGQDPSRVPQQEREPRLQKYQR